MSNSICIMSTVIADKYATLCLCEETSRACTINEIHDWVYCSAVVGPMCTLHFILCLTHIIFGLVHDKDGRISWHICLQIIQMILLPTSTEQMAWYGVDCFREERILLRKKDLPSLPAVLLYVISLPFSVWFC